MKLTDTWQRISLDMALSLAAEHGYVRTVTADPGTFTAELGNGVQIQWRSEYDADYSDMTPGEGYQPPTIWARHYTPPPTPPPTPPRIRQPVASKRDRMMVEELRAQLERELTPRQRRYIEAVKGLLENGDMRR